MGQSRGTIAELRLGRVRHQLTLIGSPRPNAGAAPAQPLTLRRSESLCTVALWPLGLCVTPGIERCELHRWQRQDSTSRVTRPIGEPERCCSKLQVPRTPRAAKQPLDPPVCGDHLMLAERTEQVGALLMSNDTVVDEAIEADRRDPHPPSGWVEVEQPSKVDSSRRAHRRDTPGGGWLVVRLHGHIGEDAMQFPDHGNQAPRRPLWRARRSRCRLR